MRLTESRLRRIIREELIFEANDAIESGDVVIIFSDWAKGHIEKGHKKPGLGSVFANVDMSLVVDALRKARVTGSGGVYTVSVPSVGYDLVLPMKDALGLPNAKKGTVEKQERGSAVEVPSVKTTAPLSRFKTDTLSVVVRPTTDMKFVPEDLKDLDKIKKAFEDQKLYSVLSAWPGRSDVPPSSQWGQDWAVVIPDAGSASDEATNESARLTSRRLRRLVREELSHLAETKEDHIAGIIAKIARLEKAVKNAERGIANMEAGAEGLSGDEYHYAMMDIRTKPGYGEKQQEILNLEDKLDLLYKQLKQLKSGGSIDLARGDGSGRGA